MPISFNNFFNRLPNISMGNGNPEVWNKVADWISRPAPNRLIMGGTAYLTQPYIDGHNKHVNETTRDISKDRTRAKVIVGTLAGIGVRQPCYNLVEAMTRPDGNKKYSKWLIPKNKLQGLKEGSLFLKNYRTASATTLSLGVMVFSNFAVDAPFTALLTNKFIAGTKSKDQKKEGINA